MSGLNNKNDGKDKFDKVRIDGQIDENNDENGQTQVEDMEDV